MIDHLQPEENYQENPELYDEQPNANSYPQHNSNLYSQHPPTNDTYAKQTNGNYMDQPPVGDPYNNHVGSYRQLYNGDSYSEQLIPNSSYRQLDSAQLGYSNQALTASQNFRQSSNQLVCTCLQWIAL